jgi:hypothetical protein
MGKHFIDPKGEKFYPFFKFFLVRCKLPFFGQNFSLPWYPCPFEILAESLTNVQSYLTDAVLPLVGSDEQLLKKVTWQFWQILGWIINSFLDAWSRNLKERRQFAFDSVAIWAKSINTRMEILPVFRGSLPHYVYMFLKDISVSRILRARGFSSVTAGGPARGTISPPPISPWKSTGKTHLRPS